MTGLRLRSLGVPAAVLLLFVCEPAATRGQVQWDETNFWSAGQAAAGGARTSIDIANLGRYAYMEDGQAPQTIRTGYEGKLYQQIKTHVSLNPDEKLTPETLFNYALYASRDEKTGTANAMTAVLTALNITRILARPKQWSTRFQDGEIPPDDAALPIMKDLAGQSMDDQPALPDLLAEQSRLIFRRKPDGSPVLQNWSEGLFSGTKTQVFSTMPGVAGENDATLFQLVNGGSHYYFWTGALAEMAAGREAADAAVILEQFTKRGGKPNSDETLAAKVEGPNALVGKDFSLVMRKKLTDLGDFLTLMQQSIDPGIRHLGMQSSTWWTALRSSDLLKSLTTGDGAAYAHLLLDLAAARFFAPGGDKADPQQFLPLMTAIADKYPRLLKELGYGETDVSKMSGDQFRELLKKTVARLKEIIEPSTLISCRIVVLPANHPDAQKPLHGTIQYGAGGSQVVQLNGSREVPIYLNHLDELDGFLAKGAGAVTLHLREPRSETQTKVIGSAQLYRRDGNLGAHADFIVYLSGFEKGDTNFINPQLTPQEQINAVPGGGKDHAIGSMHTAGTGAATQVIAYSIARYPGPAEARAVLAEQFGMQKEAFDGMKASGMQMTDRSRHAANESVTDVSWQTGGISGTSFTMMWIYRGSFLATYSHNSPGNVDFSKEAQAIKAQCEKLIDARFPREPAKNPPPPETTPKTPA